MDSAAAQPSLGVLLVGGDPLARAGLVALLEKEPGIAIEGQAEAPEALAVAAETGPDVALVDFGSDRTSLDALRALAATPLGAVALVHDAAEANDARQAGARGLLFRKARPAQIAAALRAVKEGLTVADEPLTETLLSPRPTALEEPLTARELEVLQLLAEGLSNKLIAARLEVSEHTAKFHVNAILQKLGAGTRTEAVVKAARLGLVLL